MAKDSGLFHGLPASLQATVHVVTLANIWTSVSVLLQPADISQILFIGFSCASIAFPEAQACSAWHTLWLILAWPAAEPSIQDITAGPLSRRRRRTRAVKPATASPRVMSLEMICPQPS